jgi:hypothetical protein
METRPFVRDPNLPGPGMYDVKTFVEKMKTDKKNFTIFKKDSLSLGLNYP